MNTLWMLLGMYEGRPFVTAAEVARYFFQHPSPEKFVRKVDDGEIDIPLMHIEDSTKATRGVDILDLATYLNKRRGPEGACTAGRHS